MSVRGPTGHPGFSASVVLGAKLMLCLCFLVQEAGLQSMQSMRERDSSVVRSPDS